MSRITRFIGLTVVLAVLFDACNKETVIPAPSITGFLPSSAPTGASITITGLNFSPTLADNVVRFNNIVAVVTVATATSITATVPSGNTNGAITVTVGSQMATSSTNFALLCNLTSYTFSSSGSSPTTHTYEYNSNYRLTEFTSTSAGTTFTLSYTLNSAGNPIIRTATSSSGTTVSTYIYDSNNRMISETIGSSTTTYTYNSSGQMTLVSNSPTSNSVLTYPNSTTRNYSRETFTSSGVVTIYDFEYDTNPDPFRNTFSWNPLEGENNTTKITVGTSQFIYAYTYNAAGYPLTRTGSSASTLMATYTYDCN